ncbi:hypothetical protein FHR24_001123 [Wenyingzhuangia heitensis]|uniref:Por secretion system C-terminal sorting domain-containing protein n=1 Tax=Wenyingzhuangia heitensis TaxID=1487859 RepID=A0ABX0U773_9FLAO|nr:T9SS type A sorting domain-containing protein [Wenyingzhuangia heitensis]NIJ44684.1 hypothetical protein [Wenyingzhuangia heitensis]
MKKKLLLVLLLAISFVTISNAQTTITKDPSITGNFTLDQGDNIRFEIGSVLGSLATLTCTSAPIGVNTVDFTANLSVGNTLFYDKEITIAGEYVFSYAFGLDTNIFTMTAEATTLSTGSIKKSSDFTVSYNSNSGTLTINNLDVSKVKGVSVLNTLGTTVYSSKILGSSIDLTSVTNGMYILVIELESSTITKKIIKG